MFLRRHRESSTGSAVASTRLARWRLPMAIGTVAAVAAVVVAAHSAGAGSVDLGRAAAGDERGVDCPLLAGIAAPAAVGGRTLGSFRPSPPPGPDGPATTCSSGVEPTVTVGVAAETLPAGSAVPPPVGGTRFGIGTVANPSLRIDLGRTETSSTAADEVRVSDGRRVVTVRTVWSSVDPIDGTGPGHPDVDGAVALAEAILLPGSDRR